MGNLCGSSDKADKYAPTELKQPSRVYDPSKPAQADKSKKDFGLSPHFEVIKLLGTGGEGETWLCVDKRSEVRARKA